jgi:hypothetical protein
LIKEPPLLRALACSLKSGEKERDYAVENEEIQLLLTFEEDDNGWGYE